MKKLLSVIVILCMLSICVFAYSASTAPASSWTATKASFKIMVRGQEYTSETPPIVIENRTYLPLRAMGNVLGVSIEWNAKLNQAEVGMSESKDTSANTQAELSASEKAAWQKASWNATKASFKVMVKGNELVSENPPVVIENRTFLPLRVLGDALGVKVDWNSKLNQAEVDMAATVTAPEPTKPAASVATPTPTAVPTPTIAPTPTSASSSSSSSSSSSKYEDDSFDSFDSFDGQ